MLWTSLLLFFPLKNRSKEPATSHGHLDARPFSAWTVSAENWGIRCGPESGITVVDVDPRNGGRLEDVLPLLPTAPRVKTGGGGWHFYCRNVPAGAKFVRLPGIDFKNNGYVVAPGSIHPSGNPYEWEQEGELAEFPLQWIRSAKDLTFHPEPRQEIDADILSALAAISPDDYEVWLKVGMALHATGDSSSRATWDKWAKGSPKFNPHEQEKKWRSFKADGSLTIGSLFHLAREAGWNRLETVETRPYKVIPSLEISEPPQNSFTPKIPVPILEEIRQWIAPVTDPVSAIVGALSIASLKFARTARTSKGDLPVLYFGLVGPTAANAIPLANAIEQLIRDSHLTWMLRGGSLASEEKLKKALLKSAVLFHFSHSWASTIAFSYRQPSGAMAQALHSLERIWRGSNLQHENEKKTDEEPQWIFQPAVSLVAGIGEDEFPKILSSDELGRGAHETMLFVPAKKSGDADCGTTPQSLIGFLSSGDAVSDAQPPLSTIPPTPILLPIDDSEFEDPSKHPVFGGYRRIARRIALLLSLSLNYRAKAVPPALLAWSFEFVSWCARTMEGVDVGGSGKTSCYAKILALIRKNGIKGTPHRDIISGIWEFRNMDSERRAELLIRIEGDGLIGRLIPPGKRAELFFASEFLRKVSK